METPETDGKVAQGTTPGPNGHISQQHPALSEDKLLATDQFFKIKDKVIDMKEFEALKKKLPKGIDARVTSDGIIKFRARFRKKGHPVQILVFPELKLAKHWLEEQNRNALLNIHMPSLAAKRTTLSEAIDRYIKEVVSQKPKNAKNTIRHLEWWRKELGEYALPAIRSQLLVEKLDKLTSEVNSKGKRRTSSTRLRYIASLSHLFTVAYKQWDLVTDNPVKKIAKPSENDSRERYLTVDESKRIFAACEESRCKVLPVIFAIALTTGMRYGEIMSLQWDAVDLSEQVIKIRTSKNGKPRHVPLKGKALELVTQMALQREHTAELLFPSPSNPLRPYDIRTAWNAVMKRANVDDCHFHDIRHTTASHLMMSGKGLLDVAALLGHKDLQSTKRYSHLSNEYKSKMVEGINETFFGVT